MTGVATDRRFRVRAALRRVLRILMVVLWVAWAALSWWSEPRPASADQARADLAAGRVVSYEWGDSWDAGPSWDWSPPTSLSVASSEKLGPIFSWRTTDQRIHYVSLADSTRSTTVDEAEAADRYVGQDAADMGAAVEAAGLGSGSPGIGTPVALRAVTLLIGLTFLVVLIGGPAPVVGTRWFWYALVGLSPFGLGILLWLARERPWSASALLVAADPPIPRQRWYIGGIIGLVASLAAVLLVWTLNAAFGDAAFPNP
jgi:hypothetical protein